jgi:hypothetical protein
MSHCIFWVQELPQALGCILHYLLLHLELIESKKVHFVCTVAN